MHAPELPPRSIEAYDAYVDRDRLAALERLAGHLEGQRILHVNSTATGGGVAELLRSIVPLSTDLGVETDWRVMDAGDAFFEVTKAMHNGLQGSATALTDAMRATYRTVTEQNAAALEGTYDVVVLHDPQPMGMLDRLERRMPEATFVWRCHIDLTDPLEEYLAFIAPYAARMDHAIFSRAAYADRLEVPASSVVHPSIDPLAAKNRALDGATTERICDQFDPISFDAPLVTHVSRFDPWKDQFGTLTAYRRAKQTVPGLQLALVGGMAGDDPEGLAVYERVARDVVDDPDVHVLIDLPDTSVNVVQRCSDVVVQKSLREGFGLVVSEALWKRTPVVGSDVGGIPLQVVHGRNGYLVEPTDADGAGDRLVDLLEDDTRRRSFGEHGRAHVRSRFLLPRQLADLLEVIAAV